jgi:hypothetical protein
MDKPSPVAASAHCKAIKKAPPRDGAVHIWVEKPRGEVRQFLADDADTTLRHTTVFRCSGIG